ncbi:MAG: D-alanyl-D-alanine carboxypeptidase/D-alanyl-D-alanine endopeptidase [bacterium]
MSAKTYLSPFFFCCAILALLTACAPVVQTQRAKSQAVRALRHRFDTILADSALTHAQTGVKIVSLRSGEILYERNSQLLFHPASNQKLLTSAAAIALLGPDFVFKTSIACDSGAVRDSVVQGNVYLIGRGNPDLTTSDLFMMAQALAQKGIRAITGNIVCDDFYFDNVRWASGWMWDDDPSWLFSRFTALTVNDNAVTILARPAQTAGQPAMITLNAPSPFVEAVNRSVTVARLAQFDSLELQPLGIYRHWQENQNVFEIAGAMVMHQPPQEEKQNILQPELLAGYLFRDLLLLGGISCNGEIQHGVGPTKPQMLAEHQAPILPVLINLNKTSDNLTAELLLKTIGAERFGRPGTADKGIRAVRQFLAHLGVDTLAMRSSDGSGVSRYNLVTPAGLVDLLTAMWSNANLRSAFAATLPVAGLDGTLESRMRQTPAEGVLRAKTGSLSGVSALSGYTTTAGGEEIVFSMMIQHFLVPDRAVRRVQDLIGAELTAFARK